MNPAPRRRLSPHEIVGKIALFQSQHGQFGISGLSSIQQDIHVIIF